MNEKDLIAFTIQKYPDLKMPEIAKKLGFSLRTLRKRMIDYELQSGRKRGRWKKIANLDMSRKD